MTPHGILKYTRQFAHKVGDHPPFLLLRALLFRAGSKAGKVVSTVFSRMTVPVLHEFIQRGGAGA
jgi:hypothetical protein